jgi:hypothetical protein
MVRDCLVLGSGRSGTSLLAGTVAHAGYFAGANLYEPRPSNPLGFFEDPEINGINEALLAGLTDLGEGHRWLAALPLTASLPAVPEEVQDRIAAQTRHAPFCLKDPRFCYTLEAWRPHIGDAVLLCVFRAPEVTAASILKEIADMDYLAPLRGTMVHARAIDTWIAMYEYVLRRQADRGDWIFVHYDQLLTGSATDRIERALGVELDRGFADPSLARSVPSAPRGAREARVYAELCRRAGFDSSRRSSRPWWPFRRERR